MEKFFRIFFVSVVSILLVSSIMYASSTIISVQTQSIAQGDVIANGWFQEVNDKLINIFSSGGNVGIGTNNPQQLLTIRGQYPYIRFEDTEDPNGSAGTITSHQDARMYYDANFNNSANPNGGEHVFRADAATKVLMTLKNNGNVGIGTTTTLEKLSVFGTIQSLFGGFKFPDGTVQTSAVGAGGKIKRDFASSAYYGGGAGHEWDPMTAHIKTNIRANQTDVMWRILVEGYNYGNGQPISSDVVGYNWTTGLVQSSSHDYSGGGTISQYFSSDGYLVVKMVFSSAYYVGLSASAWTIQTPLFNITGQVYWQTANL